MPLISADPLVERDTIIGPLPNFSLSFETFFVQKSAALLFRHQQHPGKDSPVHLNNTNTNSDLSWMHSIQLARFPQEQNLEIIYNNASVYFKATRPIFMNEELYGFPSKDLEISLGLAFVPMREDETYACRKCARSFRFPNCLMLHARYFCSARANNCLKRKTSPEAGHSQNWTGLLNLNEKQNSFLLNYLQSLFSHSYLSSGNFEQQLQPVGYNLNQKPEAASASRIKFSPLSVYKTGQKAKAVKTEKKSSAKSQAPDVSLLSNETSLQNWCAKCNSSFRLTSDLVYHMRTFHRKDENNENEQCVKSVAKPVVAVSSSSQEFLEFSKKLLENKATPNRSSRSNKLLKCEICFEFFKEKHHLSRHMTSHR